MSTLLRPETALPGDGRTDFDFLLGHWTIQNRRLRARLQGCQDWEEFPATATVRPILGGLGNVDEMMLNRPTGPGQAVTVRLFDPTSGHWRIYWAAAGQAGFDTPLIGRFVQGRGTFYAHEFLGDQPIFNRFLWSVRTPTTCRWEQAFSPDGGVTWETNWIMDFTRQE